MKNLKTINETEFLAFRETLPDDVKDEWFRWLATGYDVAKALFIIHKAELEKGTANVKTWCTALGMAGPRQVEDGKIHLNVMTGVIDAEALKDNINPEIPIVIVEHEFGWGKNREVTTIVIDGNKRLRKAFLLGIETVEAYMIPKNLVKLCRM